MSNDDAKHAATPQSMSPLCDYHRKGELEFPDMQAGDDACVACRIAYLEVQEDLLEQWQQRAKKAEETIAEIQRPLDAQMARLNAEVVRLNSENDRLRALALRSETPQRTEAPSFPYYEQLARERGDRYALQAAADALDKLRASSMQTETPLRTIRCQWVREKEWGYGKAMRVTESDHPRFVVGSRFDYGFLKIAVSEGYRIEIEPVPQEVLAAMEADRAER